MRLVKVVKLSLLAVVLWIAGWGGYAWYVDRYGYTVAQIEKDLCKGTWLVYQETDWVTDMLRCLATSKKKPLPTQ